MTMRTYTMGAVTPEQKNWMDTLTDYKAKAAEFAALYDDLKAKESRMVKEMKTRDEYQRLVERGGWIQSTITTIGAKVDETLAYLRGLMGNSVQGLGLVWLIPVAVVAGSVALMGSWISDTYQFNKRFEEIHRLESMGYTPEQAAAIYERTQGQTFFSGLKYLTLPAAILGGIWMINRFWR